MQSPSLPTLTDSTKPTAIKKPGWLRVKLPVGESYKHVRNLVDTHRLHTICESGNCPNMGECWGAGTATFMILGNKKDLAINGERQIDFIRASNFA